MEGLAVVDVPEVVEAGRVQPDDVTGEGATAHGAGRFPPALMHAAATLYYVKDETQADVARSLGISRATVSRLLAEARRLGIVRIEVLPQVVSRTGDAGH